MRRLLLIAPFLFVLNAASYAQVQLSAEAGGGMSYTHHKGTSSRFSPVIKPNVGIALDVPIVDFISLRSGLIYSPRGYKTTSEQEYDNLKFEYLSTTKTQYISVPFLVSFKVWQKEERQFWIDGGMNYNFFLTGHTDYKYNIYSNGSIANKSEFSHNIVGRYTSSKFTATENSYDVTGLDVAVKLQLRYRWHDKYSVNVFYDHSLYDFRANPDEINTTLKMRYAGISVGYKLF
jgi:hypothetical protein